METTGERLRNDSVRRSFIPWIGEMLPGERRALRGCWAGWALDGMDAQLYSFVVPTLIAIWGISRAQAGTVATTMLVTSAIGGWIAGYLADRVGRVRTLQLTILWFAYFCVLCLPHYENEAQAV